MTEFSVLLSVYHKEKPTHLEAALTSIYDAQNLKPDQIILVQDGPLTKELDTVLISWKKKLGEKLILVPLKKNVGLAAALNEGLKYCKHELIARMDTDDVSFPDRFEKQIAFMVENPQISVCSGLIEEWNEDFSQKISKRNLPLEHKDIYHFAKSRNPISHVAVIFRKKPVIDSGGYPLIYPEDYPLWGKLLKMGYKFANLPDCLVKVRVAGALTERRGKEFLKGEIELFNYLYKIGFLNKFELYRNIIQRTVVRLSPFWMKKILYKLIR